MARRPNNHREPWSARDLKILKQYAAQRKSQRAVALALGRTQAAVQQKAFAEGVAFRSRAPSRAKVKRKSRKK